MVVMTVVLVGLSFVALPPQDVAPTDALLSKPLSCCHLLSQGSAVEPLEVRPIPLYPTGYG